MASCSSDDFATEVTAPGQEVEVTFSAALPSTILSRAINVSDGTTANRLNYTVFKGTTVVKSETITPAFASDKTQTVSIPLITGETYDIVFWADNASSPYTYTDGVVTIDYDTKGVNANDENADAFFGSSLKYTVNGAAGETVYLYRPFAQINFGTTKEDYEAAKLSGLDISTTKIAINTKTYSKLTLRDGSVSGDVNTVTYAEFASPEDSENPFKFTDASGNADNRAALTVDGTDYVYVGYAYILTPIVDNAETLTSVTLTPKTTDECVRTYTNIPIKRNYRTNIIGNLFTSTTDWTVIIKEAYNTPDENIDVVTFKGVGYKADYSAWDGTSTLAPYVNDEGDVIIASAAQLAGFAAQTTGELSRAEGSTFENEHVYLLVDVDLNNQEWTPIAADHDYPFQGYFHGQGRTISNLKVTEAKQVAGLFGWVKSGSIENLKIQNAEIDATNIKTESFTDLMPTGSAGVLVASEIGKNTADPFDGFSYISVSNAKITSHHYAGGIIGYFQHPGAQTYVQNCTINGLDIELKFEEVSTGKWDNADKAGGIVGQAGALGSNNFLKIQNNTVNNLTLIGYRDLGGIIGGTNANIHVFNNTVNNSVISVDFGDEKNYKNLTSPLNVGKICGNEKDTMVISGNVANDVSLSVNLNATPDTFAEIMKGITTDAVINLAPGEYSFYGTTGSKSWGDHFTSWTTEEEQYEGMEASCYDNFKEGMNITLIGSGTDQTVFINSDGYTQNGSNTISQGGIGHHIMVNKANITFKNMLEIVRHYSIIDAKNETHDGCIIWGEVNPRSETVNYNNCKFYTSEQTAKIAEKEYSITTSYIGPIAYGMYCRYLNFNNCEFHANQNKAVQIYATMRPFVLIDITATDCTLYGGSTNASSNSKPDQRAFFEVHGDCSIHGNMTLNGCSINEADKGNWGGGLVYDGPWTTANGTYYFTVNIDNNTSLNHARTFESPVDIVWTGDFK